MSSVNAFKRIVSAEAAAWALFAATSGFAQDAPDVTIRKVPNMTTASADICTQDATGIHIDGLRILANQDSGSDLSTVKVTCIFGNLQDVTAERVGMRFKAGQVIGRLNITSAPPAPTPTMQRNLFRIPPRALTLPKCDDISRGGTSQQVGTVNGRGGTTIVNGIRCQP